MLKWPINTHVLLTKGSSRVEETEGKKVAETKTKKGSDGDRYDIEVLFESALKTCGIFQLAPIQPIIVNNIFNGGLLYDAHLEGLNANKGWLVRQPCARVDDLPKKSIPGVLPIFNQLAFKFSVSVSPDDATSCLFKSFLIGALNLDETRLQVTTTNKNLEDTSVGKVLLHLSIQLKIVSHEVALKYGTGSGYFCPYEEYAQLYPDACGVSYSIEYLMPDGNYIEIGEILCPNSLPAAGSFGLERLLMAKTEKYMMWTDTLPTFRRFVEEESNKAGVPLSQGYFSIVNA